MKLYPDAIFIGAINYDYIFQSKNKGEDKHSPDSGKEKLNWDIKNDHLMIRYRNCMKTMTLSHVNLADRHF